MEYLVPFWHAKEKIPKGKKMEKIGIAGVGALGMVVAKALMEGVDGYHLVAYSDIEDRNLPLPRVSLTTLADECDIVVECLPAASIPPLAKAMMEKGKTLLLLSSCALVLSPEILEWKKTAPQSAQLLMVSGALSGLDAVLAMREGIGGITRARIVSTKPPAGLCRAPYVIEQGLSLANLASPLRIFAGNVLDAAKAFPANVNVAATLAMASLGAEKTEVEVWADPHTTGNAHEILVESKGSRVVSRIENIPDPANPKSSTQAAYSVIAALKKRKNGQNGMIIL